MSAVAVGIPAAALVISVATFAWAAWVQARSASSAWARELESRVKVLQTDVDTCEVTKKELIARVERLTKEVDRLAEREIQLMRMLTAAEERR